MWNFQDFKVLNPRLNTWARFGQEVQATKKTWLIVSPKKVEVRKITLEYLETEASGICGRQFPSPRVLQSTHGQVPCLAAYMKRKVDPAERTLPLRWAWHIAMKWSAIKSRCVQPGLGYTPKFERCRVLNSHGNWWFAGIIWIWGICWYVGYSNCPVVKINLQFGRNLLFLLAGGVLCPIFDEENM